MQNKFEVYACLRMQSCHVKPIYIYIYIYIYTLCEALSFFSRMLNTNNVHSHDVCGGCASSCLTNIFNHCRKTTKNFQLKTTMLYAAWRTSWNQFFLKTGFQSMDASCCAPKASSSAAFHLWGLMVGSLRSTSKCKVFLLLWVMLWVMYELFWRHIYYEYM